MLLALTLAATVTPLLGSTAMAATCDRATTSAEVEAAVARARQAFADHDDIALAAAADEATRAVECVVEPLEPGHTEAVHLVRGLWAATEGGVDAPVPFLARAQVRAEDSPLGTALSDAEQRLVSDLEGQLEVFETQRNGDVPPPLRGRILLDGRSTERRPPANAPYVLQQVSGTTVLETSYVVPGDDLPHYRRRRPVLAATAGGFAAASLGLLAAGALTVNTLYAEHDPLLTDAEVEALRSANHGFLITAGATGAVAVVTAGAWGLSFVW